MFVNAAVPNNAKVARQNWLLQSLTPIEMETQTQTGGMDETKKDPVGK
jgi:hypothetical protein